MEASKKGEADKGSDKKGTKASGAATSYGKDRRVYRLALTVSLTWADVRRLSRSPHSVVHKAAKFSTTDYLTPSNSRARALSLPQQSGWKMRFVHVRTHSDSCPGVD